MAEITASTVNELRRKTNAGMMDCKKALTEAAGDMEAAIDILRKKGIASSAKRADREAKEGTVLAVLNADTTLGALVEVNCETDFVGKNEGFRAFVDTVAQQILNQGTTDSDLPAALAQTVPGGSLSLDEVIKAKGGEVGENIVLRRFQRFAAPANGALASYIHLGGKVGVLLEATAGKAETLASDAFKTLLKDINLHIAASSPICVGRDSVDPELVAKERAIYADSDRLKGKPAAAMEGILNGMITKFYSQVCLLEQGFVKDPDKTIAQLVEETGKALGDTITVTRFTRFALGEELKA
ncbi:MAG: tsf: translation elongation factor ts [Verrucomicrobiales bacterium]|nr:tsf: translation elongation factor ts [Verrucomicrobiales bacterium]